MARLHLPRLSDLRDAFLAKVRRRDWGIIAIVLLAVTLRIILVPQGLPLLLHEDEPIYLDHALHVGQGDFNLHYFKKPSFFIYFYAAFYFMAYLYSPLLKWSLFESAFWQDPTVLACLGRCITVAFAAGSVWMLYRIARRSFGMAIGLASAFLLAVDSTHLISSPKVISDIPALFFILVSMWFAVAISERGKLRDYALCGVSIALAMSFKYNFFTVTFLIAAHFLRYLEGRAGQWKAAFADRRFWLALLIIPTVFFLLNPYTLINFQEFYYDLNYEKHHMLSRHMEAKETIAWFVSFDEIFLKILPRALGWPLFIAGLLGAVQMFRKSRFRAVLLWSFPLVFLFVVCQFRLINAKYLLPVFPVWFISAAYFANDAVKIVKDRWFSAASPQWLHVGLIAVMAILGWQSMKESFDYSRLAFQKDTRLQARNYLYSHLRKGEKVMAESGTFALLSQHYRPHLHIATWQGRHEIDLRSPFTGIVKPREGTLEFAKYRPEYVLLYFKARKQKGGVYEMSENPAAYYDYLGAHYEYARVFLSNPVSMNQREMARLYRENGFTGLYAAIQEREGRRNRPGPLMLLLRRKD